MFYPFFMEVYKTVPVNDLGKIKEHGLASLMYQIEHGLTDWELTDRAKANPIVLFRTNCIFFGLKKNEVSDDMIQLAYSVDPEKTFVYNMNFAVGTFAATDPKYMDSKMTLAEFLKRSKNQSVILLDSVTAMPLNIDSGTSWKGRKITPYSYECYNPEVLVEKRVIPFSELKLVEG